MYLTYSFFADIKTISADFAFPSILIDIKVIPLRQIISHSMNSKIIVLAALAFFTACSNDQLPEEPKDGEKYQDKSGNSWLWNAMMMRWMVSGVGGTSHYFYPSSGNWSTTSGVATPPPSTVNPGVYKNASRKANSVKAGPAKKDGTKNRVFGKTGRSHSIGA